MRNQALQCHSNFSLFFFPILIIQYQLANEITCLLAIFQVQNYTERMICHLLVKNSYFQETFRAPNLFVQEHVQQTIDWSCICFLKQHYFVLCPLVQWLQYIIQCHLVRSLAGFCYPNFLIILLEMKQNNHFQHSL